MNTQFDHDDQEDGPPIFWETSGGPVLRLFPYDPDERDWAHDRARQLARLQKQLETAALCQGANGKVATEVHKRILQLLEAEGDGHGDAWEGLDAG